MDDQTAEGAAWLTERAVTTERPGPARGPGGLGGGPVRRTGRARSPGSPAGRRRRRRRRHPSCLLSDITTRVTGLRSAIDCAGGPAVDGADALGPGARPLPAGAGAPTAPGGSGTGTSTAPVPARPAPSVPPATTTDTVPQPGGPTGGHRRVPAPVGRGPRQRIRQRVRRRRRGADARPARRPRLPLPSRRCRRLPPLSRTARPGRGASPSPSSAPVDRRPAGARDAVPAARWRRIGDC